MKPYFEDCRCCEGRRVVGDGPQQISCPRCSARCTFCLAEGAPTIGRSTSHHGVLVAGVLHDDGSLFRGYVCDRHKCRLHSYSFIVPWMLDPTEFHLGTAYLTVQFGRVFVELYGFGEAHNWPDLEADARAVVAACRCTSPDGFYRCPPTLAAKVFPIIQYDHSPTARANAGTAVSADTYLPAASQPLDEPELILVRSLEQIRHEHQLTPAAFLKLLGVTPDVYTRVLQHDPEMCAAYRQQICAALGLHPYLVAECIPPPSDEERAEIDAAIAEANRSGWWEWEPTSGEFTRQRVLDPIPSETITVARVHLEDDDA